MKKTLWKFSFILILLALFTGCPGVTGEEENTQQEQQTSQEQDTPKEETQKEPEKQKEPETKQEPENQTEPEPPVNQISLTEKITDATGSIDFENAKIEEDAVVSKAILIQNLNLKGKKLTLEASGITLQNVTNAVIVVDNKVGEGDVTLTNCESITKLEIYGGGSNSIHINNSKIASVEVKKNNVRVALEDSSEIEAVVVEAANTKIESADTIKINEISVSETVDKTTIKGGTVEKVQVVPVDEGQTSTSQTGAAKKTQIVIDGKTEVKSVEGTKDVQLTKEAIQSGSNVVVKAPVPVVTYYDDTIVFLSNGDTTGSEFEGQDVYYEYAFDAISNDEELKDMDFKFRIYKFPDTIRIFISGVYPDEGRLTYELNNENVPGTFPASNTISIKNMNDATLVLKSAGLIKGTFSEARLNMDPLIYDQEFDVKDCGFPEDIILPPSPYKPAFTVTPSAQGNVISFTFNENTRTGENPDRYISDNIKVYQAVKEGDKWVLNTENVIFELNNNSEKSVSFVDSFVSPGKEYTYLYNINRYRTLPENEYVTVTATGGNGEILLSAENSNNGIKLTVSNVSYSTDYNASRTIFRYYENDDSENPSYAKIENYITESGEMLPIVDYYTAAGTSYIYKAQFAFWKDDLRYSPITKPYTITATAGYGEPKITNSPAGHVVDGITQELDSEGISHDVTVPIFEFTTVPQIAVNPLVDNATYNITFQYVYSYKDDNHTFIHTKGIFYDPNNSDIMHQQNDISTWLENRTYKCQAYDVYITYTNNISYNYYITNPNLPNMPDIE